MNNPEATQQALAILRNPATFQWYVMPLLAIVVYIYAAEIAQHHWKVVAVYCYDAPPKRQVAVIASLFALNALLLIVFAGILRWI